MTKLTEADLRRILAKAEGREGQKARVEAIRKQLEQMAIREGGNG